ncbi:MAG: SusC/RagA family TonB-linked outer membrane protein [Gemmatimonadetes bacterium]|nr:SusC/RagA family TonB-linked outer membrane protein [Gemmatimonadota bacterium]MCC6773177.1 SusC/RagA family TonB-linked outer membrane protein [Gemmatimonadaceae bacterium]
MRLSLLPAMLLPLGLASSPMLGAGSHGPPSPDSERESVRFAGTIRGRITEQGSGTPVAGATVVIANTRLGAVADNEGRYVVGQVPAGTHAVTVRMLGYAPKTERVTVSDNGEVVADFALERSASQLSQVVVTATGDQRRVELGNAVSTLRADSLTMSAPITSVGDLLQGRVAGLMTFANAGMTGSAPRIRIRGFNSLSQPNNPLIIVDGARVDNTTGAGSGGGTNIQSYGWTAGSVTAINPDEIESMEIVKGPAAATLYGTDAANGVIVIRTKRGVAGSPKWTLFGEGGVIPGPTKWNENYYAFGKNTLGQQVNCVNLARTAGQCTVDSVSQWNPMADAISSPVGTGYRRQAGAQVSGGAQQFRYFVAGDWERERGYLELSDSEISRLKVERGGADIPDEQIHPNYLNRAAMRANASAMLGPKADLNLSNSLQFQRSQIPTNTVFTDAAWGRGFKDDYDGWLNQRRPGESFATRAAERLVRLTSSANGNFTPLPWLLARATVGVDVSSNFSDNLQRRGEGGTALAPSLGRRLDSRSNTVLFTGDVGTTATFNLLPSIVSKTSVGAQYNRRDRGITTAIAANLPPGSSTVAGAATVSNAEATIQSVVAGGYVEQQFALNDRLFVTGAMRADGASTFGKNFKTAYYPKASVSWLVSSEDWFPKTKAISSFRFRTAYGSSGVQPPADAALTRLQLATVFVNGTTASGAQLQTLGNPNLAPERTTELEGGFDIDFFDGRISLEATAYEKKSKDALVQRSYPRSAGLIATGQLDNVGRVRNRGVEGIITATVFQARGAQFDLSLNGSINHSKLLELDSSLRPPEDRFIKFVQDFPLFGMWDRKIRGYNDANNDGVLQISEVQVDDSITFIGVTNPTDMLTVTPSLSLFNGALRLSSMFVYKGNFIQTNFTELNKCASFGSCKARNDPNASVASQAAYAGFAGPTLTYAGYAEDGTFTRWAEASIVWDATRNLKNLLGSRTASVTFSARNLALWTKYSGLDPEVTANPDLTGNFGTVWDLGYDNPVSPLPKYFIIRLSLGL